MDGLVCINGEFCAPGHARVAASDHGFLYGDGAFESLRTYGGRPFRLDRHLDRLKQALEALAFAEVLEVERLRNQVVETLRRSGLEEAALRITVTRGSNPEGFEPVGCGPATTVVSARPLKTRAAADYQKGISATLLEGHPVVQWPPPWVKSTSYQRTVLARLEVQRRGAGEGLFVTPEGEVTEGTIANVFAVRGRLLQTPPPTVCLPGITRAEVIEQAREFGYSVEEGVLTPKALRTADELFVTSSISGLVPVVRLEQAPVGAGIPGPVWEQLWLGYQRRCVESER